MRKLYPLLILIFAVNPFVFSQGLLKQSAEGSTYIKCNSFSISKPLRDLPSEDPMHEAKEEDLPSQVGGKNISPLHLERIPPPDPARQDKAGTVPLDPAIANFEGGAYYRPDATGAAGPNHYVQGVNLCNIRIYNKNGILQLATSITNLGGGSCGGDPIVLYDKFADRWLVSDVSGNSVAVAISTTPDPTGSYYIYKYTFPVGPDFPKYSVWTDGYYLTCRNITLDTVGVSVLERDRMLKGDPGAGIIHAQFPNAQVINVHTQLPGCPKILSSDGALPAYGKPNYLMYFTNINCGDSTNSIRVYKLSTDTTLKKCNLTFDTALATLPFNAYFTGYGSKAAIAQPGGQRLWSLDGTFQYRVPYIRFTGYNSAVLCNTVNLGDSVAGIRWYELRQNDTTQKWSIYQQGTYGPDDSISRWNSSICMNMNGDISLAYNVTNKYSLYPGIRFTGRLAADSPGLMTFAEQTAILGTRTFATQWGDYCHSSLDPDGLTFWHTNQYIRDPNSNAYTRIFSFRLESPSTDIPAASNHPVELNVFQQGSYLNVHVSGLTTNDPVVVNLFDLEGRQITSQWITPSSHHFENKIQVGNLAEGAYLVRIGNTGFQKVVKVVVN